MLISTKNSCEYCVDFNSVMLINSFGWSHEDVEALKNTKASIKLSEIGWDESDILDALQHGARMSAIDIVFNVFGVERDF